MSGNILDAGELTELADRIENRLSTYKFLERTSIVVDNVPTEVVKKSWNPLRRIFGGHGICSITHLPETIDSSDTVTGFFNSLRRALNSHFVGVWAYKSSHSFVVMLCSHAAFLESAKLPSKLKDRTGLHTNIIQGVILIDCETRELAADRSIPGQNKQTYDAILLGINDFFESEGTKKAGAK